MRCIHVDGHRTVGLVISQYTKRNEVISTNDTQINMFRCIENILGIHPLNKFDLTAEPMLDLLNPELSSLSGDALY